MRNNYSSENNKYLEIILSGLGIGGIQSIHNKYFYPYEDIIGYIKNKSVNDEVFYNVYKDLSARVKLESIDYESIIYNSLSCGLTGVVGGILNSIYNLNPIIIGVLSGILNVKIKEELHLSYLNFTDFIFGAAAGLIGFEIAKSYNSYDIKNDFNCEFSDDLYNIDCV